MSELNPPVEQPRQSPLGVRPDLRNLGEILLDLGMLTAEQLAEAASEPREGERLGDALLRTKACSDWEICQGLARQFGIACRETIAPDDIDDELVERLPIQYARVNMVIPWRLDEDAGVLHVLAADPSHLLQFDDLGILYDSEVEVTLLPRSQVHEIINKIYAKRAKDVDLDRKDEELAEEDEDILHASAEDAPIIRFVNSLIFNAAKEKASDIHIEPGDREVVIRNRIDGVLQEVKRAPRAHLPSIIARVKIMSGLNIAEKRLPQDGRIRRRIAGKEVDMRVATAPVAHGERVTIRLLDKSAVVLDLDAIGMAQDHLRLIRDLIRRPHGIMLVTGPTGSGKTTSLYSALTEINHPDLNILTIEDPIEFQLAGISQVQVQSKINLTFAAGLRSFLRHDPDVILVGEIRDVETAEIAIHASLTGHLVLSTIHTNDAPTGITRLVDMGVQPFLVASSLVGLMAQRLIRRVCLHCCQPYVPLAPELEQIGIDSAKFLKGEPALKMPVRDVDGNPAPYEPWSGGRLPPSGHVWRSHGCDRCHGSGYSGRTGIYEMMLMSEEVRRLTIRNTDSVQIKKAALAEKMRTLRDDGAYKVACGVTTIDEVVRATTVEGG